MLQGCQSSTRRKEYNEAMWLVLFLMTHYSVKGLITASIFIMAKNKRVKEIGREGVVNYEKPTVPTNKKKTPRNAVYTNTREAR